MQSSKKIKKYITTTFSFNFINEIAKVNKTKILIDNKQIYNYIININITIN